MGKSYKDINKQPKKISVIRINRLEYQEEEDLQDVKKYTGMSFAMIIKREGDEED